MTSNSSGGGAVLGDESCICGDQTFMQRSVFFSNVPEFKKNDVCFQLP